MSAVVGRSKLGAVNSMLHDLGDRPVNTLAEPTRLDVIKAITSLDDVTRALLAKGWWFNIEKIRASIDSNDQYILPGNVSNVQVISGGPTSGDEDTPMLVVRGNKLYDTNNARDEFPGEPSVLLRVHRLLDYEDLPITVREYLYVAGSVLNQTRAVGADSVDKDLKMREQRLLAVLHEEDVDQRKSDATLAPHFIKLMHNR